MLMWTLFENLGVDGDDAASRACRRALVVSPLCHQYLFSRRQLDMLGLEALLAHKTFNSQPILNLSSRLDDLSHSLTALVDATRLYTAT